MTADGARIVSGSWDNTVRVWDAATGETLRVLKGHEDRVSSVAVTADGARIVSGSWDGTVRVWDAATGETLRVLKGHERAVTSVAVTADDARIVSGSEDKTVRVWDATTGETLRVLEGHESPVTSIAVTTDGGRIVSGSGSTRASGKADNTVRVWDAATGETLRVLEGHEDRVSSIAVTTDGARIVSGSNDKTVRVWDAATGETLRVLKGHEDSVNSVAVMADGARIVSGAGSRFAIGDKSDITVRVWDATTGAALRVLEGHEERGVTSIAVTTDGGRIVSGSGSAIASGKADNTARVWDAATGETLRVLQGHEDLVWSVAVTADGARVVSGSGDKTVRVWALYPREQRLVAAAHARAPRCLTPAERQRYFLTPTPPRWCTRMAKWPYDDVGAPAEGARLLASKRDDEAEALFTAALSLNPKLASKFDEVHARELVSRGKNLLDAGTRDEEAKTQFDLALAKDKSVAPSIDSAWSRAYLTRGTKLLGEGKDAEAEAQFKLAQERGGDLKAIEVARLRGYIARGENLIDSDSGDKPKALADATRVLDFAVELAGRDGVSRELKANAYFERGRAHEWSSRYEAAIADFERATELGHVSGKARIFWATNALSSRKLNDGEFNSALLIGGSNHLNLDPSVRSPFDADGVMRSLSRLSYPVGALHPTPRLGSTTDVTDCDRLTAHPWDPHRTATGIAFAKITDPAAAIAACTTAIAADGAQPRFLYQRARAHSRAADIATDSNDDTLVAQHRAAEAADMQRAMELGYPMAFNNEANRYDNGQGVEKDKTKAAALNLEFFNRVMACCWAPVARQLLAEEAKHDRATVRRVVRHLSAWSAALGSTASRELLAELTSNGTLDPIAFPAPATFTDLPPWLRE